MPGFSELLRENQQMEGGIKLPPPKLELKKNNIQMDKETWSFVHELLF